uniref:Cyclin N-terminal domain-containing protein n=1 Tax=Neobodo designis TaxID=312471 RepID=A0A7S1M628_NEODS|mmetsp:Transcript_3493/g.10823  ORF Transcript_3493/g.10823 Transcript_3493/m.10823 type:complete len:289 (+) Transcript_3493:545-1411(+)|eukprot:CAMPEP_0174854088 /NCGR_PEP_ID=MMETSP1114-20130205/29925_1 /TAXON_ID=312471 /ORGANISM="Neobodo designis, Strain CCAP 1951/1" /LENGTH=288 /DNA_ID=CAMNT_0016088761 /DNA_START=546 /DNA_END=1412 /DNA_ORIENTATION=+
MSALASPSMANPFFGSQQHAPHFPSPTTTDSPLRKLSDALQTLEQRASESTRLYRAAYRAGRHAKLTPTALAFAKRYDAADPEPLTYFHSADVPGMTLMAVFEALSQRIPATDFPEIGIIAITLMLRYTDHTGLPLTLHMMHRLFFAALVLATKAHQDTVPPNRSFARAMGMPERELNRLEIALFEGVRWNAVVLSNQADAAIARLDVQFGCSPQQRPLVASSSSDDRASTASPRVPPSPALSVDGAGESGRDIMLASATTAIFVASVGGNISSGDYLTNDDGEIVVG